MPSNSIFEFMKYWRTPFLYISTACQINPKCFLFLFIVLMYYFSSRKLYCI